MKTDPGNRGGSGEVRDRPEGGGGRTEGPPPTPARGGTEWTAGLTCLVTESMSLTYRSCSVRTPAGEAGGHEVRAVEPRPGIPNLSRRGARARAQAEPSWGQTPPARPPPLPGPERASRSPALPRPGARLPVTATRSTAFLEKRNKRAPRALRALTVAVEEL